MGGAAEEGAGLVALGEFPQRFPIIHLRHPAVPSVPLDLGVHCSRLIGSEREVSKE